MKRSQAESEVNKMRSYGYHHLSREQERQALDMVLNGNLAFLSRLNAEIINTYSLAPTLLRSIKNNIICAVTVLCRAVIDVGVDQEKCYALSDLYINKLEELRETEAVVDLCRDVVIHYSMLTAQERIKSYSLPIVRAVRYIRQHLYEPCSIKGMSEQAGLHPNYLSALFKSETGACITHYVRELKLDEAKKLIAEGTYSLTEISEMLGYSSLSYFSKLFKGAYGISPSRLSFSQYHR
jgi:AraC-like DNA-binding protein